MACNARMCGPCDREKKEKDALTWCNTCGEGLCKHCLTEHKKNRASLHHKVILLEDLTTEFESFLSLNDLCDRHSNKTISLYCVSHDQLCCSECLHADHRQCKDIVTVEDVANNASQITEIEDLLSRVEDIDHIFNIILTEKNANLNYIEIQAQTRETDLLRTTELIMRQLDETKISAQEEIKIEKVSCIRTISEDIDRIKNKQTDLKALHRDLKTLKQIGSPKQVFISVKRLDAIQNNIEKEFQKSRNALLKKYELQSPSPAISSSKSFVTFGETTIKTTVIEAVPNLKNHKQCQNVSQKDVLLQLVETIDLYSISYDNWKLCYFESHDKIAVISSAYMFVVDIQSKLLEKVDLDMLGFPWYIDKYDENHAMVAIMTEKSLYKINILSLKIIGHIQLEWDYTNASEVICVSGHVVFRDNASDSFVILKNGRVLRKIPYHGRGLGYLCRFAANKILFSNWQDHTVLCVTLDGQVIFRLTSVVHPMGIAVDKKNFIYVGNTNGEIHKITPDGKIVKTILLECGEIRGMAYKKSSHELIVLSGRYLKFYRIT